MNASNHSPFYGGFHSQLIGQSPFNRIYECHTIIVYCHLLVGYPAAIMTRDPHAWSLTDNYSDDTFSMHDDVGNTATRLLTARIANMYVMYIAAMGTFQKPLVMHASLLRSRHASIGTLIENADNALLGGILKSQNATILLLAGCPEKMSLVLRDLLGERKYY